MSTTIAKPGKQLEARRLTVPNKGTLPANSQRDGYYGTPSFKQASLSVNTAKCTECKSCGVHVFNVQPAISAAADEQPVKYPVACFVSVTDRTAHVQCAHQQMLSPLPRRSVRDEDGRGASGPAQGVVHLAGCSCGTCGTCVCALLLSCCS
jgi:hypothetical protein